MTPPGVLLAAVALFPAMTGGPGETGPERSRPLAIALCGGGGLVLPLGGDGRPAPGTAPGCAKGCHAGGRERRTARAR